MNNRRDFLKTMGLLGVAVGTGSLLSECASAAMVKPHKAIGLQLYSLRDIIGKDVKGILSQVAAAGYTNVEPYGFSAKGGFWGMKPSEFYKLLTDLKLKSSSGHYMSIDYFSTGDTKELQASIEAAATLKSEYFTVPYLTANLVESIDDYKKIAEKINKIGEMCKKVGLKTAYHNHNFEFQDKGDGKIGYDVLLSETDKNLIHFEMDLYWIVRAGKDPIEMFKQNPGRFPMWHVKDMSKTDETLNCTIGQGRIDFKSIFAQAKLSGMKNFFVEQETNYLPDVMTDIKNSAAYIAKNLV